MKRLLVQFLFVNFGYICDGERNIDMASHSKRTLSPNPEIVLAQGKILSTQLDGNRLIGM